MDIYKSRVVTLEIIIHHSDTALIMVVCNNIGKEVP